MPSRTSKSYPAFVRSNRKTNNSEYKYFAEEQSKFLKLSHPFLSPAQIRMKVKGMWTKQQMQSHPISMKRQTNKPILKNSVQKKSHPGYKPLNIHLKTQGPREGIMKREKQQGRALRHVTFNKDPDIRYRTPTDDSSLSTHAYSSYGQNKERRNTTGFEHLSNKKVTWSYQRQQTTEDKKYKTGTSSRGGKKKHDMFSDSDSSASDDFQCTKIESPEPNTNHRHRQVQHKEKNVRLSQPVAKMKEMTKQEPKKSKVQTEMLIETTDEYQISHCQPPDNQENKDRDCNKGNSPDDNKDSSGSIIPPTDFSVLKKSEQQMGLFTKKHLATAESEEKSTTDKAEVLDIFITKQKESKDRNGRQHDVIALIDITEHRQDGKENSSDESEKSADKACISSTNEQLHQGHCSLLHQSPIKATNVVSVPDKCAGNSSPSSDHGNVHELSHAATVVNQGKSTSSTSHHSQKEHIGLTQGNAYKSDLQNLSDLSSSFDSQMGNNLHPKKHEFSSYSMNHVNGFQSRTSCLSQKVKPKKKRLTQGNVYENGLNLPDEISSLSSQMSHNLHLKPTAKKCRIPCSFASEQGTGTAINGKDQKLNAMKNKQAKAAPRRQAKMRTAETVKKSPKIPLDSVGTDYLKSVFNGQNLETREADRFGRSKSAKSPLSKCLDILHPNRNFRSSTGRSLVESEPKYNLRQRNGYGKTAVTITIDRSESEVSSDICSTNRRKLAEQLLSNTEQPGKKYSAQNKQVQTQSKIYNHHHQVMKSKQSTQHVHHQTIEGSVPSASNIIDWTVAKMKSTTSKLIQYTKDSSRKQEENYLQQYDNEEENSEASSGICHRSYHYKKISTPLMQAEQKMFVQVKTRRVKSLGTDPIPELDFFAQPSREVRGSEVLTRILDKIKSSGKQAVLHLQTEDHRIGSNSTPSPPLPEYLEQDAEKKPSLLPFLNRKKVDQKKKSRGTTTSLSNNVSNCDEDHKDAEPAEAGTAHKLTHHKNNFFCQHSITVLPKEKCKSPTDSWTEGSDETSPCADTEEPIKGNDTECNQWDLMKCDSKRARKSQMGWHKLSTLPPVSPYPSSSYPEEVSSDDTWSEGSAHEEHMSQTSSTSSNSISFTAKTNFDIKKLDAVGVVPGNENKENSVWNESSPTYACRLPPLTELKNVTPHKGRFTKTNSLHQEADSIKKVISFSDEELTSKSKSDEELQDREKGSAGKRSLEHSKVNTTTGVQRKGHKNGISSQKTRMTLHSSTSGKKSKVLAKMNNCHGKDLSFHGKGTEKGYTQRSLLHFEKVPASEKSICLTPGFRYNGHHQDAKFANKDPTGDWEETKISGTGPAHFEPWDDDDDVTKNGVQLREGGSSPFTKICRISGEQMKRHLLFKNEEEILELSSDDGDKDKEKKNEDTHCEPGNGYLCELFDLPD